MVGGGESDNDNSDNENNSDFVPLKPVPWDKDNNPFDLSTDSNAVLWEAVYNLHKQEILEGDHNYGLYSTYNFPLPGELTNDMMLPQLEYIFDQQTKSFKVYASPGYILERREPETYDGMSKVRYYAPYSNNFLGGDQTPLLVTNRKDLEKVISHFEGFDLNAFADRPSSVYKVVFWCNLKYFIYTLDRPLGVQNANLPEHVSGNTSLCFSAEPVEGNLCLFVALAQHHAQVKWGDSFDRQTHCRYARRTAKKYLHSFLTYLEENQLSVQKFRSFLADLEKSVGDFSGVQLEHLSHFEDCFHINLHMYKLVSKNVASLEYYSSKSYSQTLKINVTDTGHVNLILDWDKYCGKYLCTLCSRFFTRKTNLKSHTLVCSLRSKVCLENGFFRQKKNIFLRLLELGISIPEFERDKSVSINEYFVVWDSEALLERTELDSVSEKLYFMHKHRVICISIASNVPGHINGKVIIDNDSRKLISLMFEEFSRIQQTMQSLMTQKWGHVLTDIECKINKREDILQLKQLELSEGLDANDKEKKGHANKKMSDPHLSMLKLAFNELKAYLFEIPVISFNGAFYDVNLCRKHLFSHLLGEGGEYFYKDVSEGPINDESVDKEDIENDSVNIGNNIIETVEGQLSVLKRRNKYLMIRKQYKYIMLDLANYLAVGISLRKFISMHACSEEKGYFPYTFLSSFSKLEECSLPPYPGEYWMNDLTNIDLLDEEHYHWERNPNRSNVDQPQTGAEKYQGLLEMWNVKGFTTVRDYLVDYALKDVVPLVEAITKFQQIWKLEGVECFKEAVSLPGLSNILMWKDSIAKGINFPLISKQHKHFYLMVRENIVAGQSIVFTRYQKRNKTRVTLDSPYRAKQLIGYDCTNLYGYVMSLSMPIMTYIYRQKPDFKPEFQTRYRMMYVYNKYLEKKYSSPVISKQTHSYDVRMGPYYLDGLILSRCTVTGELNRIAVSYNGCIYHGHMYHDCPLFKKFGHKEWYIARNRRTVQREKDLEVMGLQLENMWDCIFRKEYVANEPYLQQEEQKMLPDFYSTSRGKGKVSPNIILDS